MNVEIVFVPSYDIYALNLELRSKLIHLFLDNLYMAVNYRAVSKNVLSKVDPKNVQSIFLKYRRMNVIEAFNAKKIFSNVASEAYLYDNVFILRNPDDTSFKAIIRELSDGNVHAAIQGLFDQYCKGKENLLASAVFGEEFVGRDEEGMQFSVGAIAIIILIKFQDHNELEAFTRNQDFPQQIHLDPNTCASLKKLIEGVYVGNLPIFEQTYERFYSKLKGISNIFLNPIVIVENELNFKSRDILRTLLTGIVSLARGIFTIEFLETLEKIFIAYDKVLLIDSNNKWSIREIKDAYRKIRIDYRPDLILSKHRRQIWFRETGIPPTQFERELDYIISFSEHIHNIVHIPKESIDFLYEKFKEDFRRIYNQLLEFSRELEKIHREKISSQNIKLSILSIITSIILMEIGLLNPPFRTSISLAIIAILVILLTKIYRST